MNPLSVLVALFAAVSLCWIVIDVARGRSTYWNIYKIPWSRPAIIAAVVVLLLDWAWNIYKGL
jgi:ABC-type sugar transport system permease subunit